MKNITKIGFVLANFCLALTAFGQQTAQSNVYGYNRFSLNPAYAGEQGCTEVFFSHLNQWTRVEGAPVTSLVSANSRIGKKWGIGGSVLIDKLGMLQQVAASGSASYGFTVSKEHKIRLGITAGYYQFRLNPDGAVAFDLMDNIVNGGSQSSSSLNSEIGFLYQFKGLEASFSSKQVIQTFSNFGYSGLDGYGLKRHFVGLLGYKFELNSNLSLKPSILYKGINTLSQLDVNADMVYKNLLQGGLGYRTGVGLIGRIGINLRDVFFIGYAYEAPIQNIASYGSGSHELILGLKLCRQQKAPIQEDVSSTKSPLKIDTVYSVERIVDTLIVERVDTVYLEAPQRIKSTDEEPNRVFDLASKNLDLEFENDKSIILKKSYGELESLTNMLLIRSDLKIRLEGYTDNNGSTYYNLELSKNRVQAVKDFLVANGVEASRIETAYFGESNPIADNATEEGKAKNRRVEMHYIKE